jgi:hypothetical protein
VETIGYFLKRYREDMVREKQKKHSIEEQLKEFENRLRHELRLAATFGHKSEGGCGSDSKAPSELVSIGNAQLPSGELVQLGGD